MLVHLLSCMGWNLGQGNPLYCFVVWYVGEGMERGQCTIWLLEAGSSLAHFPSLHPLPVCRWRPSSCFLSGGSEWMGLHMFLDCVVPLNGFSQGTDSFFHHSKNCWFLQAEVIRLYFLGTGNPELHSLDGG